MLSNDTSSKPPPATGTYDWDTFKPGAAGFPALGETYTDPVFGAVNTEGSVVRRLSDVGANAGLSDNYAHHRANADGTYFMDDFNIGSATSLTIRSTTTGAIGGSGAWVGQPYGLNANTVIWHPTDPDKYFYFSGASLMRRNLAAQTDTTVKTFAATLAFLGGSQDFVDRTGRYFVVLYSGTIKVYDSTDDVIYTTGAFAANPTVSNGYVMMAPDGNYLIQQEGTFLSYALNHGTDTIGSPVEFLDTDGWTSGDHAGFVSASDNKTYAVVGDNDGAAVIWRVDVTLNQAGRTYAQQTADAVQVHTYDWLDAGHFTAVGRGTFQNWVFFSHESTDEGFHTPPTDVDPWRAYKCELVAINVITLEVRRLCHARCRWANVGSGTYYNGQIRPSCSWDGSFVFWMSNFNDASPADYNDFYGINNPLGAVSSSSQTTGNRVGRRRGLGGLLR